MPADKPKLIIWGAGGHAAVVADIVQLSGTHQIAGFVDDVNQSGHGKKLLGLPIWRDRRELSAQLKSGTRDLVVAAGDCAARLRLAEAARQMGFRLATAIHPGAIVASSARVGAGTVVAAGAVVGVNAVLGSNVIVNTGATVDHDCRLGDGVHICPGTHLAGNVRVGRGTWVGIGSIVIERVRIGKNTFIGAGSVVVGNIPQGALAFGSPAKRIRAWSNAGTQN